MFCAPAKNGNLGLNKESKAASKYTAQINSDIYSPLDFNDKQTMADYDFKMNVTLPDVDEQHMLHIRNGVLIVYEDTRSDFADVFITCPKNALFYIITNNRENMKKTIKVEGNTELVKLLAENMNQVPVSEGSTFNIIEP